MSSESKNVAVADKLPSAEIYQRFFERERTARKQAEQLLEVRSRELYLANQNLINSASDLEKEVQRSQAVFQTAAEGIVIFNESGRIESLNRAGLRIFGFEDDDILGKSICDLIPSACQQSSINTAFMASHPQTDRKKNEALGIRKDGTTVPLEFVTSQFSHQGVVMYSGIIRDLTHRRLLEQRLAHAEKMESVGQLAAGVAHELNTPIQFVNDNTSFLKSSFEDMDEILNLVQAMVAQCREEGVLAEASNRIEKNIQRVDLDFIRTEVPLAVDQTLEGTKTLARIVQAMKVFSHPGSTTFESTDLNQALDSVLTISASQWRYCAQLVTDYCPDLPHVYCLPGELNQVFLNLITNAAYAMSESNQDKTQNRLTVRTLHEDGYVTVEISDNGGGIPESIQHRIFDPFFTTKGVGKGTGQGLSISYNMVVNLHCGELTFESTHDVGTTFRIRIPIHPDQGAPK